MNFNNEGEGSVYISVHCRYDVKLIVCQNLYAISL
jgi:hypothetical protein